LARSPAGNARGQVLDLALDLFAKQGFQKTSLRQIADSLGFTKAALYYYFPAKDDILATLVDPVLDAVDDLLGNRRVETPEDRRAILEALTDILLENQKVVVLIANDLSTRNHVGVGPRIMKLQTRLQEVLAGPNPDIFAKLGATGVVAILQAAAIEFANERSKELREAAVDASVALMDVLGMVRNTRRSRRQSPQERRSK
jgi:AcrR family transcriptional regulator